MRLSFDEAEARLRALGPVPPDLWKSWRSLLGNAGGVTTAAEVSSAVEAALTGFALERHATAELKEAFRLQYPDLAQGTGLEEHYARLLERSPDSAEGLLMGLRGKVFELRLPESLEGRFPGYEFRLSESATQGGWDLVGTGPDGAEIFVQAKARAASAAGEVVGRMEEAGAPEFFAVTQELHAKIMERSPELADRLIETDVSHLKLDEEAEAALSTLSEQLDINVPDGLADMLPYVGEIMLGIRLVKDVVANEKALAAVPRGDRTLLHAVKALTLMARFGVSTVLASAGGAAGAGVGSFFPGLGTAIGGVVGSVGGAFAAGKLNKTLEPYLLDYGLKFAGFTRDDLFYFQNKAPIDQIGLRLQEQSEFALRRLG